MHSFHTAHNRISNLTNERIHCTEKREISQFTIKRTYFVCLSVFTYTSDKFHKGKSVIESSVQIWQQCSRTQWITEWTHYIHSRGWIHSLKTTKFWKDWKFLRFLYFDLKICMYEFYIRVRNRIDERGFFAFVFTRYYCQNIFCIYIFLSFSLFLSNKQRVHNSNWIFVLKVGKTFYMKS